jgi:hypothetical protein
MNLPRFRGHLHKVDNSEIGVGARSIVVRNVLVGVRPELHAFDGKVARPHLEDRSSVTSTVVRKNLSPTVFLASRSRLLNLSRTHQRILVMQPTEYCLGLNRAEVVEPMARSRQRHRRIRRRIGNARTQRRMWPPAIVMRDPRFERLTQMRLREQPVQTFSPKGSDDALTKGVRLGAARWALQHPQRQPLDGIHPARPRRWRHDRAAGMSDIAKLRATPLSPASALLSPPAARLQRYPWRMPMRYRAQQSEP